MGLLWLATQNLSRRWSRTVTLVAAVAVAAGAVFATSVVLRGIDQSLTRGLNKFGADLLIVPQNALVNMKTALLTGEPSSFYMPERVLAEARAISGAAKVSPQLFLTTADGTHCIVGNAFLVGIDPTTDFTVLPWLTNKFDRGFAPGDAVVGGNSPYELGDVLYFYGQYFVVYGKLDRTGIGLYDNAIFISIDRAYGLAEAAKKYQDVPPLGFRRGEVSAVLIQIGNAAKANLLRFALARDPEIKVITAGNVITSVRQNVAVLFGGTLVLAAVLVIANILMIAAIFSSIVNERRRELGLLRAIGATRRAVFRLVEAEALVLTTLGGLLGIVVGALLLRAFVRTVGYNLELLNIPFLWPTLAEMTGLAASVVSFSMLVGTVGAVYPAITGSRMDPYDSIRAGE
jgi:putative ABC transport system permease protein